MGPEINTKGNESYPSMNEGGEFFFSSDGHPSLGGKDIFVTKQKGSGWLKAVRLDSPINSTFDDFGIITDPLMNEGFFSSNRGKTIDIYHFKTNFFSYLFTEPQVENQFCLAVSDTGTLEADTLRFKYVWDFGDNSKYSGRNAIHCFDKSGRYLINLDIVEKSSGKLFFHKIGYDVDIQDFSQPFINCVDVAFLGETVSLDGVKSHCPGYSVSGYYWELGDGTSETGDRVVHSYAKSGDYLIKLGLILKSQTSGELIKRSVSKAIKIFANEQDKLEFLAKNSGALKTFNDVSKCRNVKILSYYTAEGEYKKESDFQVVILTSKNKIPVGSTTFRLVPSKYSLKEIFDSQTGLYCYIVDSQLSLMATYPAYSEMLALGFGNAFIRLNIIDDPAEKELYLIKKNYNLLTDINLDANNILTTNAFIMLDQVVNLMNKYPNIKLEVGVHTDNQGIAGNNMKLSQFRAQVIVNYLINRGVSGKRLFAKGYGSTKPVASNAYPTERRNNRRIDFIIVNNSK
jgi:hypothetical protein